MVEEIKLLERFISADRLRRIDEVLAHRTRNLVVVFEDVHDPHNAAACLRSLESLGIQEVHVVQKTSPFRPSPKITNGADKWLDLYRYRDIDECIRHLKSRQLVVASSALVPEAVPIRELDFRQPVALVFGNEHDGVSPEMRRHSDLLFQIPMIGFSQSFNVSVACAIATYHAVCERVRLLGHNGDLPVHDRELLRSSWIKASIPMADELLSRLRESSMEKTEEVMDDSEKTCQEVTLRENPDDSEEDNQ
jgi:tRNA (guanosine-2'-O-)-methyltransferase